MEIWRKVRKTGALSFKSTSYLLPNRPELLERFQWVAQQIQEAGGEATVALVSELGGISHEKMARLFNDARVADYEELIATLKELVARGRKTQNDRLLTDCEIPEGNLLGFFSSTNLSQLNPFEAGKTDAAHGIEKLFHIGGGG